MLLAAVILRSAAGCTDPECLEASIKHTRQTGKLGLMTDRWNSSCGPYFTLRFVESVTDDCQGGGTACLLVTSTAYDKSECARDIHVHFAGLKALKPCSDEYLEPQLAVERIGPTSFTASKHTDGIEAGILQSCSLVKILAERTFTFGRSSRCLIIKRRLL